MLRGLVVGSPSEIRTCGVDANQATVCQCCAPIQQLRVDHFVADGVADQFGRRMDIQLAMDGRPVGLDRLDTEIEDGCGLLIAVAHSYQLQHGALAWGQWAVVALGQEGLPQRLGDHAREEWLVLRDRRDGRQEQPFGVGFQHIAQGTRLQQVMDEAVVVVHGEDEHLGARAALPDLPCHLQTVEDGQ